MAFEFNDIDIRTITCTSSIGKRVADSDADLERVFDMISVGVDGVRFAKSPCGLVKGQQPNKNKASSTPANAFGTSIVMAVAVPQQERNIHAKLFKNGTIQLAGALTETAAYDAAAVVSRAIGCPDDPIDLRIRMINSGFRCNTDLNRSMLYSVLKNRGFCVFFDPCFYSALKLSVFFDPKTNAPVGATGMCQCKCFCGAKRPKKRWCKMVTTSIFESGYIGITGASTVAHVHQTYDFVKQAILSAGHECALPKYHSVLKAIQGLAV